MPPCRHPYGMYGGNGGIGHRAIGATAGFGRRRRVDAGDGSVRRFVPFPARVGSGRAVPGTPSSRGSLGAEGRVGAGPASSRRGSVTVGRLTPGPGSPMLPGVSRRRWIGVALFALAGVALVLSWTWPSSRPVPERRVPDGLDVALAAEYLRIQFPGSYDDLPDTALIEKLRTKHRKGETFEAVVLDLSSRPVNPGPGTSKYEEIQAVRAVGTPPPPTSRPDWRRPLLAGVGFVGLPVALLLVLVPGRPRSLLTGEALEKRARDLGVDVQGDPVRGTIANVREVRASDADLQRRVMDAERSHRESRLWWIAFVSVLAALASAVAAWVAISR